MKKNSEKILNETAHTVQSYFAEAKNATNLTESEIDEKCIVPAFISDLLEHKENGVDSGSGDSGSGDPGSGDPGSGDSEISHDVEVDEIDETSPDTIGSGGNDGSDGSEGSDGSDGIYGSEEGNKNQTDPNAPISGEMVDTVPILETQN